MAVLEKERIEAAPRRIEAPATAAAPTRRSYAVVWTLAALALAATVAAVVLVTTGSESADDPGVAAPAVQMPDFRSEQRILADLAIAGYIPYAAVDWDYVELEPWVIQGHVPKQALQPYTEPVEPLWTAQERRMIELAATGQIPPEAVDWQKVSTKRLINQGLIPRQAAD
jgi:hypothetical protein